jgi:amino-acid N-acetyltransferase
MYRKPVLDDIGAMQAIVKKEVEEGIILPRSDDELATNIRSYIVAEQNGEIIGYTALHIHSPRLGEIRSLVVKEGHRGKGIGTSLVTRAVREAEALGLYDVLALTYNAPFFEALGFKEIPKESIPEHKIWADCIKCKHFPVCNEISLIKTVR